MYYILKNFISELSFSDIFIKSLAVVESILIVAVSSCIEAVVSSADAAFCSEIAERLAITSLTCCLASSQEPTLTSIAAVSCLDTLMPSLTSTKLSLVALSLTTCSLIRSFVEFISSTVFSDSCLRFSIICLISPAASSDCDASFCISDATTANPFPASPALADSIEAFNAKRLVWSISNECSCFSNLANRFISKLNLICNLINCFCSMVIRLR